MNNFDFDGPSGDRPNGPRLNQWDILSIIVLVITVCIAGFYLLIFINPNVSFNPFPPPPTPYQLPTATITPIQLPATWTATNPPVMTATDTPPPTYTLIPTVTPFSLVPPTNTPKPTSTPKAPFYATIQYIQSTIIHPDLACNWFGVGGTVVDANNAPMVYVSIRLIGLINGNGVNTVTVSGIAPSYGQSGWEFPLGNKPVDSNNTLYLQLTDQSGIPLSDNIYINTYSDCSKNLVFVHFKKRQ